jgi:restriction system protein
MPTPTLKRPKGKMSMSSAAFELLREAENPMHYRKLTDRALKDRLILTSGKTPEQSLRSQISMEIRRKGTKSRFVAKGSGVYALSRFGKRLAKGEVAATRTRKVSKKKDAKAPARRRLKKS